MVCSMLAVVSARLDAKYGVELLKSEAGLKALAQALAQVMGGVPVIQRNGETAYLTSRTATVRIWADGIQVQASRLDLTPAQIAALSAKATELAQALAIPLVQERLVAAIKAQYGQLAIQSDARQGAARVTKIRIPL